MASPKDEKSNIIVITSITTESGECYILAEDMQHISLHTELVKTVTFNKVKNTLKKRHQCRKENQKPILMTEELQKVYIDDKGNIQFKEQFLEERLKINDNIQNESLNKLLEKLVESAKNKKENQINLKNIAEKFMIEKFTSKHLNSKQWMNTFEKECIRFEIIEDSMKIEVLRLFLDKSCLDWHYATLTKLTVSTPWSQWKNRFLETFADKGWN